MKKLLTILGAIGLTVSTSTAVVSCTTKKVEFTFEDFASVNVMTWNGSDFGVFYQDDFDFGDQDQGTIKNKAKVAAYVAAGFKNREKVYNKIIADETKIFVYRKNKLTGGFANLKQEDLTKIQPLFFQLTDSTNRKSNFLSLNFSNLNQSETIFNLENWFNESLSEMTIKVKDVEDQLKDNAEDEIRQTDLQIMQNLRDDIVSNWTAFKNVSTSPISATDRAINAVLNYLGEYLTRVKGYVSDYSNANPTTIKQQLKNGLNQNIEWKNKTRVDLEREWKEVKNIHNGEILPFRFNFLDQTLTINFDFSD